MKAGASSLVTAGYNIEKVIEGKASMIFTHNIEDPKDPSATFLKYENGALRANLLSFHMAISPSKEDNMSQEQIIAFAQEMMNRLGYGNQPYALYRHNDIEREHYHIVSVRVDENGVKIDDSFERKRCWDLVKELAPKYGYTPGAKIKNIGSVAEMEEAAKEAMSYHFKRGQDFIKLMRFYGVGVKTTKKFGKVNMLFYAIDRKTGKRCSEFIPVKGHNFPSTEQLMEHLKKCRKEETSPQRMKEKENIYKLVTNALSKATTEKHFRNILRDKGINIKFEISTTDKTLRDVIFIDTKAKCLFSIKDMKGKFSDLTLEKTAAARQQWPDRYEPQWENLHKELSTTKKAMKTINRLYSAVLSGKSRSHEDEEIMRKGEMER